MTEPCRCPLCQAILFAAAEAERLRRAKMAEGERRREPAA